MITEAPHPLLFHDFQACIEAAHRCNVKHRTRVKGSAMIIRRAERADIPRWVEMRSLLWPDSADSHRGELNDYFDGRCIDIVEALVAVGDDGLPIGFVELNIRNFAEGSRSAEVPYVEGWFVDQRYRGQGIGKRLMRAAESWALEKGYLELASDTELDNTISQKIHKAMGFKETERVVCFLKPLKQRNKRVNDNGRKHQKDF